MNNSSIVYRCPQCGGVDTAVVGAYLHWVKCNTCTEAQFLIEACTGSIKPDAPGSYKYGRRGYHFPEPGWCVDGRCLRKSTSTVGGRDYCGVHNPDKVADRRAKREAKREAKFELLHQRAEAGEQEWRERLDRCEAGNGTADDWRAIRGNIRFGYTPRY